MKGIALSLYATFAMAQLWLLSYLWFRMDWSEFIALNASGITTLVLSAIGTACELANTALLRRVSTLLLAALIAYGFFPVLRSANEIIGRIYSGDAPFYEYLAPISFGFCVFVLSVRFRHW